MSLTRDFLEFVKEYQILGLAIGFVIGAAVKDLVNASVDDILMPLVGIFLPGGNWETATLQLFSAELRIGHFLGAAIDSTLIALILFLFVRYILRKEEVEKL